MVLWYFSYIGEIRLLLAAQEALLEAGDKMPAGHVTPAVVTVLSELTGKCLEFAQELYTKYWLLINSLMALILLTL